MPSRTLPNILAADVVSRNTKKSCYVTIGTKVYDITEFLDDHPGGADFILEYGGKDVKEIMGDEISHFHSEAAYEILDEHFIGFVANKKAVDAAVESSHPDDIVPLPPTANGAKELKARGVNGIPKPVYENTGMSSADDLSVETDLAGDFKTYKFLDLNRPLFMQIWRGGFSKAFYLEQVHRPRHYKGGQSAPLFGNFLEPLSKTPWWAIPLIWWPPVAYGSYITCLELNNNMAFTGYWILGLAIWTLIEYVLHRLLFHMDG